MEGYALWFQGAFTVLGVVQWAKGLWPNPPKLFVVILTAAVAVLYSFAPEKARLAGGILAATQVGWDIVMQPAVAGARALRERVLTRGESYGYSAGTREEGL